MTRNDNNKATTRAMPPMGAYAPRGWERVALLMARLGFRHGEKKRRLMYKVWQFERGEMIADIVKFGVRWRVDFSDNPAMGSLIFSRDHNRREIAALIEATQANGVFVDIGANVGYYALRVAHAGARVVALEPNPLMYQRLLFNVEANSTRDKITALPLGVGDKTEEKMLSFERGNMGGASVVLDDANLTQVAIQLQPLVHILESQGIRKIDALKIDIEGAEDIALMPFFRTTPPTMWPRCIVIEVSHRSRWKEDVVEYLKRNGYQSAQRIHGNMILRR